MGSHEVRKAARALVRHATSDDPDRPFTSVVPESIIALRDALALPEPAGVEELAEAMFREYEHDLPNVSWPPVDLHGAIEEEDAEQWRRVARFCQDYARGAAERMREECAAEALRVTPRDGTAGCWARIRALPLPLPLGLPAGDEA